MAAAAALSIGGSLLSGITGGKGAKKAAQIQAAAYQKGIDEQHRQFDITQANEAPFLQGGTKALTADNGLLAFLGLDGADKQGAAIAGLKGSPEFTSLYNTGQDTILQNAAATGGLRGGNTQNSLANFGSNLLSTVIQNHLANLGGLVSMGSGTAGTLGALGQQNASAVADLLGKQGGAQATAAAAPYAAFQGFLNQQLAGGSALGKLTGGW